MKTLLVTGSNGLLGTKLLQQALGSFQVVALDHKPCSNCHLGPFDFYRVDIRDPEAVLAIMTQIRPQTVVHTAAMTNVDACELQQQEAWAVNVIGTKNIAEASSSIGAHVILLSTDYVFSGDNGPYAEDGVPQPLSVYGRTKLAAEQLVAELCSDYCIARTSSLYGHAPAIRPNFATWLVDEVRAGRDVTVVTDQTTSPTLADNLATMVLAMAEQDAHGIYHVAGAEWLSRYDFALRIAQCFRLDVRRIHAGETAALKQVAPRPRHSGLIMRRVAEELGVRPVGAEEGLRIMRTQQEAPGR